MKEAIDINRVFRAELKPRYEAAPRVKFVYWRHDLADVEQYNNSADAENILTPLTKEEQILFKSAYGIIYYQFRDYFKKTRPEEYI